MGAGVPWFRVGVGSCVGVGVLVVLYKCLKFNGMNTSRKQAALNLVSEISAAALRISAAFAKTTHEKVRYRALALLNNEFGEAVAQDPPDLETANAAMEKMNAIALTLMPEKKQFPCQADG
mgnify:CR=1 FL=1